MKRLIYQVSVGPPSLLYQFCIDSVKSYCWAHKIDHHVQTVPMLRIKPDVFVTNRSKESYQKYGGYLPIYEKENAFAHFDEYDQIAIVDADIYIKGSAPNIFDELTPEYDFGAVCEREMPLTLEYVNKIKNYSRMQYSSLNDVDWKWNERGGEFFNMGLMVMNKEGFQKYLRGQSPKEFLNRYEFKRFIDGDGAWKWSTDQTLLNWWIKKEGMSIKHLPWKYNALYKGVVDEVITEAHFVHFFLRDKLPNKGEDIPQLWEIIHQ